MTPEDAINSIQYVLEKYALNCDDWDEIENIIFNLADSAYCDGQDDGGEYYARNTSGQAGER